MRNITFDFLGQHRLRHGVSRVPAVRKGFFVDELGWDIPHNEDVEMDQYDNPCAHYSLVLRRGKVVGGAGRCRRPSSWGRHTYMLRDALRGSSRSDSVPSVMPFDIASDEVWEGSRLVISDAVTSQSERAECLALIFGGLVDIANRNGGSELVGLTRPPLVRALRQLGFAASRLGEPYIERVRWPEYAVLRMPAMRSSHLMAAE